MSLAAWSRSPKVRRHLAATALVLAAGGLVLVRGARARGTSLFGDGAFAGGGSPPMVREGAGPTLFTGPGVHGSMSLSHRWVGTGAQRLYADLVVSADAIAGARERAPIAMAIVLDTSGSMDGAKMNQAREAVRELIRDMRDDDEVALVRYSDQAEVVQGLARVGDVRRSLIRRVDALTSGGGTAIPRGLRAGLGALRGVDRSRVSRVVLVSDGLDTGRDEAERLAQDGFERRITVSSLGIGVDFDESYMACLALAGHGNFAFVEGDRGLATFLHKELDEAAHTTVEDARVTLSLPPGVHFVRAVGADARPLGDEAVELRLGSLFAGDERRVLVELSTDLEPGATRSLAAAGHFRLLGGTLAEVPLAPLAVAATDDARRVDEGADGAVLARATSVLASERQREAAEAFGNGDVERGRALTQRNVAELRAAKAAAPAPAVASLEAQAKAYDSAADALGSAPAGSHGAKAAAKRLMESETANATRNKY